MRLETAMIIAARMKKRKFQSTGFGLERDVSSGDALPPWKQKMRKRVRKSVDKHLSSLKQRLEQQKQRDLNLSPNSRKQNANNTINSFKKSMIEQEIQNYDETKDEKFDKEQQYEEIYAELAHFLESETGLNDLRSSYIASLQQAENKQDAQNEVFDEFDASFNESNPCCPVCCKSEIYIAYRQNAPCYECLCGVAFRPSDDNMTQCQVINNQKESGTDVAKRMLKTLKETFQSLMNYHSQQNNGYKLNFGVNENGYLQAWCNETKFNTFVI